MISKIKHYTDKCIEYIITHTVWSILVYLFGVITLNIPRIITQFVANKEWFVWLSTMLSLLSLISIFCAIWIFHKAFEKRQIRAAEHKSEKLTIEEQSVTDEQVETQDHGEEMLNDIHFRKVTIGMYINKFDDIEYTMKFDGTVNCDSLDEFYKHLSWTGSHYKGTQLVHCNYDARLEDNIGNRDKSPFQMKLCFDEDVPRGARVKFSTKTFVADDNKDMIPISSFYVKYPIDELVLELTAPLGVVYGIKLKCYKDSAREILLWVSKNASITEIGNIKTFSFSILNPQPWQYYVLEWNFSEQY